MPKSPRRKLRRVPARRDIVRAKFKVGWWVKTYIGDDKTPTTEVWFLTRRGAKKFAR